MRHAPLLIAITTLLGLGVALSWPDSLATPDSNRAAQASMRWAVGAHGPWRMVSTSSVDVGTGEPIELRLDGLLALRVFSIEGDTVRTGMQLGQASLSADGENDLGRSTLLGQPFAVKWSRAGEVRSFEFGDGMPVEIQRQLEATVHALQFVVPNSAPSAWTAVESDVTGTYRAGYERNGDAEIVKRKLAYLSARMHGTDEGSPKAVILRSTANATLDHSNWLKRASVDERIEIYHGKQLLAQAHLRVSLEPFTGVVTAALLTAQDLAHLLVPVARDLRVALAPKAPEPVPSTAADRQACRDLLAAFELTASRDHAMIHQLADMMRLHPDLAQLVADGIRKRANDDLFGAGVSHAIELAGHAEAQQALVGLFEDRRLPESRRRQAIAALGGVESVTEEACASLTAVLADTPHLSRSALLALGDLGSRLRLQAEDRYLDLRTTMLRTLDTAADRNTKANALRALGNTADASFGADVAPLLSDTDPVIRSTTAEVLGKLAPVDARVQLTEQLLREGHSRVRASLAKGLRSLGQADVETCSAVARVLDVEQDSAARRQMASYLVDHLDTAPASRAVLENLLKRETDPRTLSYVAGRLLR